jgi:hypothetical protein
MTSLLDTRRVFLLPVRSLLQVFSHMILRHQRYQRKTSHMIFTDFNHAFLPKPDFDGYRNNAKKEFEGNRNCIGYEEFYQESNHPSTFMKMVKEITRTISAVNGERRQVLPSKVIWDGTINRFEVFRSNVEDHEKLSPYFVFCPHDVIQHTLRQTTQLAKSTIHYPMIFHLKSRFQMLKHKRLK